MKQVINLKESDLYRMIKNAVTEAINELTVSQASVGGIYNNLSTNDVINGNSTVTFGKGHKPSCDRFKKSHNIEWKKLFIFCMLCGMAMSSCAQDIVGKWKCSKAYLEQLGFNSDEIKGTYKFKKDSTFTMSMNVGPMKRRGSLRPSRGGRPVAISVSGKYYVSDGKITTSVNPEDIKCNVDANVLDPDFPDGRNGDRVSAATYDSATAMAAFQENTIMTEMNYIWEWHQKPIAANDKSVRIGDQVELKRK